MPCLYCGGQGRGGAPQIQRLCSWDPGILTIDTACNAGTAPTACTAYTQVGKAGAEYPVFAEYTVQTQVCFALLAMLALHEIAPLLTLLSTDALQ